MPVTVESVKATVFALSVFLIYPICIPGGAPRASVFSCTFAERASASMDSIDTGLSKSSSRSVVARFLGGITSLSNQIYCWFNVRRMEPNRGARTDCQIELWMIQLLMTAQRHNISSTQNHSARDVQ